MARYFFLLFFFIFISQSLFAQDESYRFLNSNTKIKNPFELRDPFKKAVIRKKSRTTLQRGDGINFTNIPSIEDVPIDQIRIIGVMLGAERRAIAKIGNSESGKTGSSAQEPTAAPVFDPSNPEAFVNQMQKRALTTKQAQNDQNKKKDNSDQTFFLKEGMRLGQNNAELKAILPGGIVLVEKIRNVYDQDEFLETVIPVTAE